MDQTDLFYRFGIALFIGVLVGLQREHSYDAEERAERSTVAGVRTFALMSLVGCAGALAADVLDAPAVFATLLVVIGGLVAVSYHHTSASGEVGITTEVAAIVTILAGALAYWDMEALAVAVAVVTVALLSLKLELHRFAERLTREDVLATVKFAVITAVVLPVLPDQTFGPAPFDVLNPRKIWLMVVFISGISFLGYVLVKLLGSHRGIAVTGLLGGLASSTAVTLSMSARSRSTPALARAFAMATILSWSVMFARVLVEVAVVHAALLSDVWLPVVGGGVVAVTISVYWYHRGATQENEEELTVTNPFELGPAVGFGLLYGVVLLITRAAQLYLGDTGIYLSSIASGLADVDAITLSMAELTRNGGLEFDVGATAIVLAVASNTLVKGALAVSGGSSAFRKAVLPAFSVILLVALGLVFIT